MTCAACEGGGCGQCGLSGALTTRERGEAEKQAELTLPKRAAHPSGACLRLPCLGGEAEEEQIPRGHLLVHVRPGEAADAMVARLPAGEAPDEAASKPAAIRAAFALSAIALVTAVLAWLFGLGRR